MVARGHARDPGIKTLCFRLGSVIRCTRRSVLKLSNRRMVRFEWPRVGVEEGWAREGGKIGNDGDAGRELNRQADEGVVSQGERNSQLRRGGSVVRIQRDGGMG